MGFEVSGAAYDRFMGRYSRTLAPQLADFAGIKAGQRVLDVGSGPGALTTELVARLGAEAVVAVDPSATFVEALGERLPDVEVRAGVGRGAAVRRRQLRRRARAARRALHGRSGRRAARDGRVTKPAGVVAACVWDHAGERSPLATFWRAARELDPDVRDESGPRRRKRRRARGAVPRGRTGRRHRHRARGGVQARKLRGVVGAVHARRRPRRRVRDQPRRRHANRAAGTLPRTVPRRAARSRLGRARQGQTWLINVSRVAAISSSIAAIDVSGGCSTSRETPASANSRASADRAARAARA